MIKKLSKAQLKIVTFLLTKGYYIGLDNMVTIRVLYTDIVGKPVIERAVQRRTISSLFTRGLLIGTFDDHARPTWCLSEIALRNMCVIVNELKAEIALGLKGI